MGLTLSKYNIISKIKDFDDFFIVNILSGNADIMSAKQAEEFRTGAFSNVEELIEKGYLVNEPEEQKRYKLKHLEFLESRERDEIQLFFVPRYGCNFSCSYCYQSDYESHDKVEDLPLSKEITEAFFDYVDKKFSWRRKYVTIFGGEPLTGGERAKLEMGWLLDGATARGLDTAVVTNGYMLSDYIELFKNASIREIQVTLDGPQALHDQRRQLKNGGPTFQKIVEGIDAALLNGLPINLRVVVDKNNVDSLKELAAFAIKKGWTRHRLFKTQLGRNYELHSCTVNKDQLFSRISLYEALYTIIRHYPEFLEFHRPALSVSRFLFENGELPDPLFDSCPGTKTEWAFDYTGNIYACTATVGKKGESLGTFYPTTALLEEKVDVWEERSVSSIPACKECSLQLACGGGCAAVAKNKSGDLNAPDCRPVRELLELGTALYFT